MSATIDHLRVDHRVTVLRDFTDATGITLRACESGVLTGLTFNGIQIGIELQQETRKVSLKFPLKAQTGPRIGHMREFFELGEDVTTPRDIPAFHDKSLRTMIVPPPENIPGPRNDREWSRVAQSTEGPDRLEAIEQEMRASIQYIGVAASIAEIYVQRMRAFQRAGNEARAIAAFKLAVEWMGTYAGWATSGGEGAALSYDRDQFHAALVREFGYDPTEEKS